MNNKLKRVAKFEELEKNFENGFYDNLPTTPTELIIPLNQNFKKVPGNKTNHDSIDFQTQNIIQAPQKSNATRKAILVFCSAKNPGGGVKRGSVAQEEEISLHSNWYFKAKEVKGFYLNKGDSAMNTDNMIYVENGYILKNEFFEDIPPLPVSFIGATAINLKGMLSQNKSVVLTKVHDIMEKRIENVLNLAENKKITHLYLGAWGCGIFGLDPQKMANIFKQKISENHFSGHISFVIQDPYIMEIFQKELAPIIIGITNESSKTTKYKKT